MQVYTTSVVCEKKMIDRIWTIYLGLEAVVGFKNNVTEHTTKTLIWSYYTLHKHRYCISTNEIIHFRKLLNHINRSKIEVQLCATAQIRRQFVK